MRHRGTPDEARAKLLDAADQLLARYGFGKMTVDDLAKAAEVGKGTVYLSFDSKESVALGCIDRMVEELLERLRAIAASGERPGARVRAMLIERVLHRFDYARKHSRSIDDLLSSVRPRLLERRADYFRAEARILAEVLEEGRRSGAFSLTQPDEIARALVLATNALLPYSLSVRELGRRAEIARSVATIADLTLRGLTCDGAAPRRRSTQKRSKTS